MLPGSNEAFSQTGLPWNDQTSHLNHVDGDLLSSYHPCGSHNQQKRMKPVTAPNGDAADSSRSQQPAC